MIIYGTRASHVKSVQLHQETCPHCNSQGTILVSTYAKYAHVFWIPLFPLGRLSLSECQHCKQVLQTNQMPSQIRAYHERNLAETRLPIWQFAGLVIIGVLVVTGIFSSQKDKEQEAFFLESPMSGDVYEYKAGPGSYTTFKLVDVAQDTVEVSFNTYEVNKITGINQIDKEENYSDTTIYLSRAKLVEMYAAGDIVDINRR